MCEKGAIFQLEQSRPQAAWSCAFFVLSPSVVRLLTCIIHYKCNIIATITFLAMKCHCQLIDWHQIILLGYRGTRVRRVRTTVFMCVSAICESAAAVTSTSASVMDEVVTSKSEVVRERLRSSSSVASMQSDELSKCRPCYSTLSSRMLAN